MSFKKTEIAHFIIFNLYVVGAIGFLIPTLVQLIVPFTAVTLFLSCGLLVWSHQGSFKGLWLSFIIIAVSGFLVELLGIKTGEIFGEYQYISNLGFKLCEVPLIIGINWFLLVYLSHHLFKRITSSKSLIVLLGAALMTCIDFLIEPFAIKYSLWEWNNVKVPTQNYVVWFLISVVFHLIFFKLNSQFKNKLAIPLLLYMVFFFVVINLFGK